VIVASMSSEDHLKDGAVVVGWTSGAEIAHGLQNGSKLERMGGVVEPLVAEEIAVRIFGFCNSVAHQDGA
jgi:hypothetical protein